MQLNSDDVLTGPAQPHSYTESPVSDLCAQITVQEFRVVPVEPHANARKGECFKNVKKLVELSGGRLISGWAIWNWSGLYARAEHHAIWEQPDGQWIDPTPKDEVSILFAVDPTATLVGATQALRLSKWQPESRVPGTDRIVDLEKKHEQAWFDLATKVVTDDAEFQHLREQMNVKRQSLNEEINYRIQLAISWIGKHNFLLP